MSAHGGRRATYLSHIQSTRLGRYLVRQGVITAEQLGGTLDKLDGAHPLGQVLVKAGLLTEEPLTDALRSQCMDRDECCSRLLEQAGRDVLDRLDAAGREPHIDEECARQLQEQTRLGALLCEAGLLSREQLDEALNVQTKTRKKIGDVLVSLGAITNGIVECALRLQRKLRKFAVVAGACAVIALSWGCNSYDYQGRPAQRTPWDTQWEKVRGAIEEAGEFSYRRDVGGDRWQTPEETEAARAGDCEDVSIWLYAQLVEGGVDGARLCIGKRKPDDKVFHAWVTWNTAETTYILDATIDAKMSKAKRWPAGYYKPYYSYDMHGKYVHHELGGGRRKVAQASGVD